MRCIFLVNSEREVMFQALRLPVAGLEPTIPRQEKADLQSAAFTSFATRAGVVLSQFPKGGALHPVQSSILEERGCTGCFLFVSA